MTLRPTRERETRCRFWQDGHASALSVPILTDPASGDVASCSQVLWIPNRMTVAARDPPEQGPRVQAILLQREGAGNALRIN